MRPLIVIIENLVKLEVFGQKCQFFMKNDPQIKMRTNPENCTEFLKKLCIFSASNQCGQGAKFYL